MLIGSRIWKCLASLFVGLFIIAVGLTIPRNASAQHRLEGKVTVGPDHRTVPGVYVYIADLDKGTTTDKNGRFSFSSLPPTDLSIGFSHLGYRTKILIVNPKQVDSTLTVHLERRIKKAPPLLVTGDRPRKLRETPLNVQVIEQARLIRKGEASLWAALEETPGVWLQTNGPGVERPVIRGLSSDRIQILNQGVQYHYQTWDPESGLSISGNNTEQVEIIRGPATLRYGGGAIGGVIALEPERPAPVGKTIGSFRTGLYSNTGGIHNALSLKGARKGYFWGVDAGYQSHADYNAGGGRTVRNTRYNHLQLQANGGLTRSWGTTRLSYEYLRHRNGIVELGAGEEEEGGESTRAIHPPYHNLEHHALISETNWYRGDTQLNLTLGLQHNRQQEFEPHEEEGGGGSESEAEEGAALDLVRDAIDYRAEWIQSLEPNLELTAGLEGDFQRNRSEGREHFVPNASILNAGAFGILSWDPTPMLTLRGGVRYDYSSIETEEPKSEGEFERRFGVPMEVERSFQVLSGSAGLSFHPGQRMTVKANVATGYRTPNLAELTADGLLREVRRYKVGNPNFDAEYNIETDLGFTYRHKQFTARLSGYVNWIDNYIYQKRVGTLNFQPRASNLQRRVSAFPGETYDLFRYRQADARLAGGEARFALHPTTLPWLRLETRYSFVDGRLRESGNPLPMMPAPRWTNSLKITRNGVGPLQQLSLKISLQKTFAHENVPIYAPVTDGYLLTDLHLTGQIPFENGPMRINLSARNLFDVKYISPLSKLKYEGIPNIGRTVSLTVELPFNIRR